MEELHSIAWKIKKRNFCKNESSSPDSSISFVPKKSFLECLDLYFSLSSRGGPDLIAS